MIRKRSARALAGGLATILLLVAASAAYAAVSGHFSGKTKQKLAISFHVGNGRVTAMDFHIRDKCPSGHVYAVHDFNFPAIKINKFHKFDERFSNKVLNARAEIKGTVFKQKVTGSVAEGRVIAKEHHFCSGSTTFTVHKQ
jgi:hypothetical protein